MPDTNLPPGSWGRAWPALRQMARNREVHPALSAWLKERRATAQRRDRTRGLRSRTHQGQRYTGIHEAIADNVADVVAALGLTQVDSTHPYDPEGSIDLDGSDLSSVVSQLNSAGVSTSHSGSSLQAWQPRWITDEWFAGKELGATITFGRASEDLPPIDAVITWVDGSDLRWRANMMTARDADSHRLAANHSRFKARGQLRYVLRSIHQYTPWVRKIFLVTDGQQPDWLITGRDVVLIDHHDILPEDSLPTFNSHAIETALHRIPDLTEHFVYFNDDTFAGLPLGQGFFFAATGRPIFASAPVGISSTSEDPVSRALANAKELLAPGTDRPLARLDHSPRPLLRSTLYESEEQFNEAVVRTRSNKFRSGGDVSMLSQLNPHLLFQRGSAELVDRPEVYINVASRWAPSQMRQLLNERKDATFTLNDTETPTRRDRKIDRDIGRFLEAYFPFPSPWEK